MAKEEKRNKRWIWSILIFLLLLSLFIYIKSIAVIKPTNENTGVPISDNIFSKGGYAIKNILGISQTSYDEGCLDTCDIYWDDCEDENYDEFLVCEETCMILPELDLDDLEFAQPNFYIKYIEVIPSAYAYVLEPVYDEACVDDCYDVLFIADDECAIIGYDCYDGCQMNITEIYEWNGIRPTNINNFYETNYPDFYSNLQEVCEGGFYDGVWVAEQNQIGCLNFAWDDLAEGIFIDMMCNSANIKSAGEVCETIGGTFTCEINKITCEI